MAEGRILPKPAQPPPGHRHHGRTRTRAHTAHAYLPFFAFFVAGELKQRHCVVELPELGGRGHCSPRRFPGTCVPAFWYQLPWDTDTPAPNETGAP